MRTLADIAYVLCDTIAKDEEGNYAESRHTIVFTRDVLRMHCITERFCERRTSCANVAICGTDCSLFQVVEDISF